MKSYTVIFEEKIEMAKLKKAIEALGGKVLTSVEQEMIDDLRISLREAKFRETCRRSKLEKV